MSAGLPLPGLSSDAEIAALIETLHQNGQRLEELTAGEVDTVSSRDGRTVLLRSAQEHLRYSEAAKQAAILNALPANIALVDIAGVILSVNAGWRRFAIDNGLAGAGFAIGVNYLEICDAATGADAQLAQRVKAGIREVLAGTSDRFSIEYSCDSPVEARWYLLTVTPLGTAVPNGAVLMHLDITANRQAEESLRLSESRFRQLAQNIRDVFLLQSADMTQVFYVSPAYELLWGRTCASLYVDCASWIEAIHPEDRAAVCQKFAASHPRGFDQEFRILRPDQEMRWVHLRVVPVLDGAGNAYRTAGLATDITLRKEAEIRIKRLNRVYAVLSGINALIVRARDRDELFREACRIAVEQGGFRLSWIGLVDRAAMQVTPVASAGADEGFLDNVKERLSLRENAPYGYGVTVLAVNGMHPIVVNDVEADARVTRKDIHVERGIRALISLPLVIAEETVAIFDLHAGEIDFFDAEEIKLLHELANNLAFAIDNIEKRATLDYLAFYDVLTGLANRRLFIERATQYMRSAALGGYKLAVYLVDLERFKNINESLGRPAADALLKQVADWLVASVGDTNLLGRMGADHFAVLLPKIKQDGDVARLLGTTLEAFHANPFIIDNATFRLTAKVGIALFPDDGADAETLIRHAEAALGKAKTSGDRYLFYTEKMTDAMAGKLAFENDLRHALDNGEFVLHYQPKVSLRDGKLTGVEALIRWNDPRTHTMVPPGDFIPVLEETGLIHAVGRWVLQTAVADHLRWRAAGVDVRVAVNVSVMQLRSADFIADIEQIVGVDAFAARGLELEITESMIMEDVGKSVATLQAVRALGIGTAIDDFGTGFSSLSYLSKLPIDTLKIDRLFVVDMTMTQQGLALVSTIVGLAHSLRLNVVAEGVETEEQARLLRLLDCDEMQGYLSGRPITRALLESRFLNLRPSSDLPCNAVAAN